tara:strand:+ start:1135 stop:1308 length:174 start_codon:yes stop_codon:yes gene_type:complete
MDKKPKKYDGGAGLIAAGKAAEKYKQDYRKRNKSKVNLGAGAIIKKIFGFKKGGKVK